jgi:hypothetical protein
LPGGIVSPGLFMEEPMKQVEALYGPYAGAIISIDEKDAEKALEDGWARDPYDPKNAAHIDLAANPNTVDVEEATKAAEKFAAKIRGEAEEGQKKPKPARPAASENRASTAGQSANYQTRDSKPESSKSQGKSGEE